MCHTVLILVSCSSSQLYKFQVRKKMFIHPSTYLPIIYLSFIYHLSIYLSIRLIIIYAYPQPWAQWLFFKTTKVGQPELEYTKLKLLEISSFFFSLCLLHLFPSGPHFPFCYPSWLSTTPLLFVQKLIKGRQCSNLLAQLLSTTF